MRIIVFTKELKSYNSHLPGKFTAANVKKSCALHMCLNSFCFPKKGTNCFRFSKIAALIINDPPSFIDTKQRIFFANIIQAKIQYIGINQLQLFTIKLIIVTASHAPVCFFGTILLLTCSRSADRRYDTYSPSQNSASHPFSNYMIRSQVIGTSSGPV